LRKESVKTPKPDKIMPNLSSSASKNFVRKCPVNDVVSHWRSLESDCSFRLFSDNWKLV